MKANPLSHEEVYALACSANALAAKQIRKPHRWAWLWGDKASDALRTCATCHRVWVEGMDPPHADYCPVGRTIERALRIIALGCSPHGRTRFAPSDADFIEVKIHGGGAELWVAGVRIALTLGTSGAEGLHEIAENLRLALQAEGVTKKSHHERSGANGGTARASEDSSGANHSGDVTPFEEPWAWDPQRGQVVDKYGFVIADMVRGTDLTAEVQGTVGERITTCVNFCRGVPDAEMRDIEADVAKLHAKLHAALAAEGDEQDRLLDELSASAVVTEKVQ